MVYYSLLYFLFCFGFLKILTSEMLFCFPEPFTTLLLFYCICYIGSDWCNYRLLFSHDFWIDVL